MPNIVYTRHVVPAETQELVADVKRQRAERENKRERKRLERSLAAQMDWIELIGRTGL